MSTRSESETFRGLTYLVDRITPWLFDVGSWIFGGLIALNLVVIVALIPIGPADTAIRSALSAFACAMPLSVAGIFLLRLVKDSGDIRLDDLTLQSFRKAGFPDIDEYFPPRRERRSQRKRRSHIVLGYAAAMGGSSMALTVAGLTAALWHVAWWIAVVLLAALVVSVTAVMVALAHSLPPGP